MYIEGEAGHFSYMSTRTLKQHLLYEPFLVKLLKRLPKEVGGLPNTVHFQYLTSKACF